MQDAGLQHVSLALQHEDSLRRQSPRCRNAQDVKNQVLLKPHERTFVNRLVVAYTKSIKAVCPICDEAMKNKEATCTCALECD